MGLREVWGGIPKSVDAAFCWGRDNKVYFFKGSLCWCWDVARSRLEEGFPASIESCWPGLPSCIDAAFTWGADGKTYFFKGAEFWCYDDIDHHVAGSGGPFPLQDRWVGVPDDFDAVFTWDRTGKTYFFKGSKFWRFDDRRGRVEDGYPARLRDGWKGIPPMSERPTEAEAVDEFARCMEQLRVNPETPPPPQPPKSQVAGREVQLHPARPAWDSIVVEWGAGPTPRPKARMSRNRDSPSWRAASPTS